MRNESHNPALLTDACVLIDFCKEDDNLLTVVSKHLGKIFVPSPVLAEVAQLDESTCERLGLNIYQPTEEQLNQSLVDQPGLSWQDRLCLVIARAENFTLYSNDKKLLATALKEKIPARWGLELLIELAGIRIITRIEAMRHGKSMCARLYHGEKIFVDFQKKMNKG